MRARRSTPFAATRAVLGVLPIEEGGTGATTEGEARANLDVPGLSSDNVFTGSNEFGGAVSFQAAATFDDDLNVTTGALNATGDPSTISTLAVTNNLTVGGVAVLTDAPSDGNKYVRQNGAWVAIP